MSDEQVNQPVAGEEQAYGYSSDDVKVSPFNFGLNAGVTFLKKFEWIPNGGKDGAEQEALDIIFEINGTEKSYRVFPITQAFGKNNETITDPKAPEFKEAVVDLNSRIVHILHCFVPEDTIKAALARPIKSFKEFAGVAASVLPKGYEAIPLDIFLQFQWNLKEGQTRTYLDIPTKMKYGRWITAAKPGTWKEQKVEEPTENVREALTYINEKGEKHPFVRNGWFMLSNFATQQRAGSETSESSPATTAAAAQTATDGAAKASAW